MTPDTAKESLNSMDGLAVTPITVTHPETVDINKIRLFREPAWQLRLTIEGDRSYTRVKVVRAAPLTHPDTHISMLEAKDEEVCLIVDPTVLDDGMRAIIKEELDRRYLTSLVQRVDSVRMEFGTSYWDVVTDRGPREFVIQNVTENLQWLGDFRLLLVDVDGNRFEIVNLTDLDKKSLSQIELVI
jgi:hypothetical protein